MSGPKPKPTTLKLLTGNPGKRPLNDAEPQPLVGDPGCPSWLDAEAKREWKRIAPELVSLGLLTILDRATFAAYCQAWADLHALKTELRRFKRIIEETGDNGALQI